jgi:hypothetical protein
MYRVRQPIRFRVFILVLGVATACAVALSLDLLWITLRSLLGV